MCNGFRRLTYTIAEFNPNAHHPFWGICSSLSSIRFQPVDLNRFNRYLEIEYSTKNSQRLPLVYAYLFVVARGDVHTRDFLTSDQLLNASWDIENLPYRML